MQTATLLLVLPLLVTVPVAHAQHQHPGNLEASAPVALMPEMGTTHLRVTTANPQAQAFFNQGLALVYGFNHAEAVRAFRRAAELDPQMAMAHWGVALALGPNINMPMDAAQGALAYEALRKAQSLASSATERDRAYIDALAKRYTGDPALFGTEQAQAYAHAMKALVQQYPDDLDAATLYAESLMDLRPWQLWSADGKPAEGTEEIMAVLESVLRRDPNHLGANHYYVHTVEASPHPEWALPSAARLETLAPGAGHVVHMGGHIYMRTGDYAAVIATNEKAVAADRVYIEKTGATGVYPVMYAGHNYDFLVTAYSMSGQFDKAMQAARELGGRAEAVIQEMPMVELFLTRTPGVLVRFQKWDQILDLPDPGEERLLLRAFRQYARGLAFAAKGETEQAEQELAALEASIGQMPAEAGFSLNSMARVTTIAATVLKAHIAEAKGDRQGAIEHFRQAVALEDALAYNEPPDWYYPVRESLGGALLRAGRAQEAEVVFREDLERTPRNGRSLYGLAEALRAQGDQAAADEIQRQFESVWHAADTELDLAML